MRPHVDHSSSSPSSSWFIENTPGSVSFKNIKFDIFKELFSRGRCNYVPVNFCVSDASIAVTSKDAASIFGSTKAGLPQLPSAPKV